METYSGKTIIAWLTYNESYTGDDNRVLYIFPRYIKRPKGAKNLLEKMPEEFANDRIDIYLPPGKDAPEEYANYGPLVEVKFIEEPKLSSRQEKNIGDRNYYTVLFSMIEIEKFHEQMIQVIDTENDFSDIRTNRFIEYPASLLFTNELILGTNDYAYYGPFEVAQEGEKVLLSGKKQYHYFIKKYSVFEINRLCMPINDDKGKPQALFIQRHDLPLQEDTQNRIDWMSDEELADKFRVILKTIEDPQKYTKREINQISAAISKALALNTDVELTEERNKRLGDILDRLIKQEDFIENVFLYVMNNPDLFEILVSLLAEEDFKKIEEKNSAFSKVRERLTVLETEKTQEEKKIEKLTSLQKELKAEIQELKNMERQLQDVILKSLTEFSNREQTIVRAIDAKWLNRIFESEYEPSARTIQPLEEIESIPVFDVQLLIKPERSSGNAVIERIYEYIKSANRDISRNDVVNCLTCIMQGFITTFAGEPGTGKTSLCTILAKSLGLARTDTNSRFIDISVERGWTSHKDFIGYYNPLTKQMEKSNNEVFDAFSRLDKECAEPVDAPFFILLDEANLSPIEHYWATFLKLCDSDSPHSRSLVLGGNHFLKIPEHLRFLATVNFDHTTEELSPRFLDRSWIITLNPPNINSIAIDSEVGNFESIIPFSALSGAFLSRNEINSADPVLIKCHEKWEAIQRIFQKNSLSIMPRNQKMVRTYYTTACRYMERDDTWLTPLDYAVSQKILPIINGTGKHYQTLLTELWEACRMMPLCDFHIGRILKAAGENMGFYQFFAK
ncbi:MAG: AAA family ATPase [Treponema sp.]|jgi:hypothetical protein|nr:AAA family ATPase [Treponema sp.]